MTIVALFGPPAAGKSTLIVEAQKLGIPTCDVECLGTTYAERKKKFFKLLKDNHYSYFLVGVADLRRHDFPPSTIKILLLPQSKEYIRHVHERNDDYPHKKGQHELVHYDHFVKERDLYDLVFDEVVSDLTLLKEILRETNCPPEIFPKG
ncbi:hypothetical protein A2480_00080 [Candidatus Uhrbacteria bacterium RIFOXYC2_FULL_47_19]|uniref:Uncharacterized protein n=1 Tax=Candidatus Uhrbacteria bacterium RIFOXYC2_FULL_47_19 TaxID=1802424 RepID=A0A1F7WDI5_9BACT|nr:MAG: hypothetical protein A2480_00080 [Candidatus Uhrbacteria bacterium RIFOXYC2_FULL_47_19]HCC22338.1 hypothetical protein [Candidatus Uhrbacteria bacterium]